MDYLVGDVPSKSAKPLIALTWRCTARHLGKPGRVAWSQGLMLKWPRMVSKLFSMKKKSAINFQCWRKLWQWGCNLVFLSEKKGETHILVERTFEATVWFFFFFFSLDHPWRSGLSPEGGENIKSAALCHTWRLREGRPRKVAADTSSSLSQSWCSTNLLLSNPVSVKPDKSPPYLHSQARAALSRFATQMVATFL